MVACTIHEQAPAFLLSTCISFYSIFDAKKERAMEKSDELGFPYLRLQIQQYLRVMPHFFVLFSFLYYYTVVNFSVLYFQLKHLTTTSFIHRLCRVSNRHF